MLSMRSSLGRLYRSPPLGFCIYRYRGKHWPFDITSRSVIVSTTKAENGLVDPTPGDANCTVFSVGRRKDAVHLAFHRYKHIVDIARLLNKGPIIGRPDVTWGSTTLVSADANYSLALDPTEF